MEPSYLNNLGRLECEGMEFTSGDVVEVCINGSWKVTRIEFNNNQGGYYSVDGYQLLGCPIRST